MNPLWKIALWLNFVSGISVAIFYGKGFISGWGLFNMILATAIICAGLTMGQSLWKQ